MEALQDTLTKLQRELNLKEDELESAKRVRTIYSEEILVWFDHTKHLCSDICILHDQLDNTVPLKNSWRYL